MEKKIENLINVLGCSREEAIDIIESDKRIDKGEKLFELTDEQKKVEKKLKNAGVKTVYTFQKRERKADEDKATLINTLFSAVLPICDTYEVTNAEREFLFTYNGKKYKVVLSAPRS